MHDQERLQILEFEKLMEEYPRFPDIHDVAVAKEDMNKIVVSSCNVVSSHSSFQCLC